VSPAYVAAPFVTTVEIFGGLALIIGVFTPIVALLNMFSMAGAFFIVHLENGVFVGDGGYELVLALFAGLAVIAMLGGGKFSVDGILGRRTEERLPVAAQPSPN
jgi:putative oxidoreductase